MSDDDFFIGWESKPPERTRSFLRKTSVGILALACLVAGATAALQKTVSSNGRFEFGAAREFSGIFLKSPVPMLIADEAIGEETIFYLVGQLKHGVDEETANQFDLKHVSLTGTYIGDDMDVMIEVVSGSVTEIAGRLQEPPLEIEMGEFTISGEIVDSKCHLGVMNPGRFKPHRACAIQCVAGGIPPILVARNGQDELAHYLLVGVDGEPINQEVLDYIAEPVEVSGALKTIGARNVIYTNPANIVRR